MSPFEVLYDYLTPIHIPYFPKDSSLAEVDTMLQMRETTIQVLQHNLCHSQHRMKSVVDGKHTNQQYQVANMVYIKLQPYRQVLMH